MKVPPRVAAALRGAARVQLRPARAAAVPGLVAAMLLVGCSSATVWTADRAPDLREYSGDAHCDQDSATFLELEGDRYVRDPESVVGEQWRAAEYATDVPLPAGASDTGYRDQDGASLWRADDGTALYVVRDDAGERWPRVLPGFGCD